MATRAPAIRKAAILLDSLDPATADALMDQMPSEQATQIRQAVMQLGEIDRAEQARVVDQFLRGRRAAPTAADQGFEIDDSLAEKLAADRADTTPPPAPNAPSPFRFLHQTEGTTLTSFLRKEHPQTVAVVLAHLPPGRAAEALEQLPEQLQSHVVRRLSLLGEADPEVVREVEVEMRALLADQLPPSQQNQAGLATMQAILRVMSPQQRQQLLAQLAQRDQQLAALLADDRPAEPPLAESDSSCASQPAVSAATSPAMANDGRHSLPALLPLETTAATVAGGSGLPAGNFERQWTFQHVAQLDDASLAAVLQQADQQVALIALTGAPPDFVERILGNLPMRDAKRLRRKIQTSGPFQLRDVDRAQHQLTRLAERMLAAGKIQPGPAGHYAA